jgi:hypothetical protein
MLLPMEYLTLVIVLGVVAALGWFAYGMDPHYASKDGTRFLSNTQEFMGGKSLARKREARCSVLPDGTLHVVQKAGLRRKMQVWTLTGKQPHPKKAITVYVASRREAGDPAALQLMIRVPNRSRAIPVLDRHLEQRSQAQHTEP